MSFDRFLRLHKAQLESLEVPVHLWGTLHMRLQEDDGVSHTGHNFRLEQIEYEEEGDGDNSGNHHDDDSPLQNVEHKVKCLTAELKPSDPLSIFLIDHMWTFELQKRNYVLKQNESLVERLLRLLNFKERYYTATLERKIELINEHLFKHCQSYLENYEGIEPQTFWYVMDEFGCRLPHSFNANFRCVPFIFYPSCVGYSLLYPTKTVLLDEEVTINYVHPYSMANQPELAQALRIPWEPVSMAHIDPAQVEKASLFAFSYTTEQMRANLDGGDRSKELVALERPLKVYSEYRYINLYLNAPRFELVAEEADADIRWYYTKFTDYRLLTAQDRFVYISQFPYENVLTVKDLFAVVGRRAAVPALAEGSSSPAEEDLDDYNPAWLMPTYDLQSELPQFVSLYQRRQARGMNNHWIVKPWNLSRSIESVVTRNLNEIVKLRNALPKVVSKYVDRPVLFYREDIKVDVKFDLRFIVLLKRVKPLELAVYRPFWIRFANLAFTLDDLYNYEKHFTVMNYHEHSVKQMKWEEFVIEFNSQYGKGRWARIEKEIYQALRELFTAATARPPPCGFGECHNSRSMYGVDVMLRWKADDIMQPTLLEVNWTPDCRRACEYYPQFFNEIFSWLFVDETSSNIVPI